MDKVTRKYTRQDIDIAGTEGFDHGVITALVALRDAIEPMRQLDKRSIMDILAKLIDEARNTR
jgi:hypothetical protein